MNFLHPVFLYALPLAALPILIHLITRRKRIVIPFSTLRFLRILENKRIRRLRIQQWLLLLLRTAAVFFAVMAFSRPLLKGSYGGAGGGTKNAAVFILDNSLSMGTTTGNYRLFEAARENAEGILAAFSGGDEIMVLLPVGEGNLQETIAFSGQADAVRLIRGANLSYARGDISLALKNAHEALMGNSAVNREIYVLSDFQNSGFDFEMLASDSTADKSILHFLVNLAADSRDNTGVTGFRMLTQIFEPNKDIDVEADVSAYGSAFPRDAVLNVYLEEKRVAQRLISFPREASNPALISFTPENPGVKTGFVETEPDQLDEDNRRYFTFSVPEEISVLIITPEPDRPSFFGTAINPHGERERAGIRLEKAQHPLAAQQPAPCDVLVYYDVPKFNSGDLALIREYLDAARGVLIALTDKSDLSSYNQVIARDLRLPASTGFVGESGGASGYFTPEKIELEHPVFQNMFDELPGRLNPVHIYRLAAFPADSSGVSLVALQNGLPLVSEYRRGSGKMIVFAGGTTTGSSDFPLKGLFAPLVNRCVRYLAQAAGRIPDAFTAGSSINFSTDRKAALYEIEKPDGTREKPAVEVRQDRFFVTYNKTDLPGIYTLMTDGVESAHAAVNCDPRESDTRSVDFEKLNEVLTNVHILPPSRQESLEAIREARFGMELTRYLIAAVLAALGLEMWIARYRKEEEPLQTPEQIIASSD